MIKTILVPATGNQTDDAVFTSALTAARAFNAHLDFLHVRVDAAVMVAAMATDGSGAVTFSGLVERIDEEPAGGRTRPGSCSNASASVSGWRLKIPRPASIAPRRNGFGRPATRPIGFGNMAERQIFW